MKNKVIGFVAGILVTALALGVGTTAHAASIQRQKQATLTYNDINITMNGELIFPTDAHGNYVEPFIIDGTTYLPVRGIANALGLGVDWDGATSTVMLTGNDDATELTMCKNTIELLSFYKRIEESTTNLDSIFNDIGNGNYFYKVNGVDFGKQIISSGPYAGKTYYQAAIERTEDDLDTAERKYNYSKVFLTENDAVIMAEYKRLANLAISNIRTLNNSTSHDFPNITGASAVQNSVYCKTLILNCQNNFWANYLIATVALDQAM